MKLRSIKSKFKNNWWYIVSPAIVLTALFIVYGIKGVFPFGKENIAYFDMAQSYVPSYFFTHDVLHFKSDLFLNWNAGLSGSMADTVGYYVLFPLNLFFYFVPRNMILESMSFFLALYLGLISASMTFFSYSKSKNALLAIGSGVIYACSGFVIQYYSNIFFLNTVLILPLLIWSLEKLIKENIKKYFLIILPFFLLSLVQLVFSVGIYLLVKSFIEIHKLDKSKRKNSFTTLFFCTLIGFATASVILIPEVIQLMDSSRANINNGFSYVSILNNVVCEFQGQKNFMLYGSEFFISALMILVIRKKMSTKYMGNVLLVVLFAFPILFENVDMLLHAGSYVMFPMRFAFILTFEALLFLNESFGNLEINNTIIRRYNPLIALPIVVFYGVILYAYIKFFTSFGIRDGESYYSYWIVLLVAIIMYLFVLGNDSRISSTLFLLVAVTECALGLYGFVAPEYETNPECYEDFIYESVDICEETEDFDVLFDRIKDNNFYLNSDYSFVLGKTSSSGWMNGIGSGVLNGLHNMGYDECYFRALDCGGTALTDSILGYKYSVFDSETFSDSINETLYSSIDGKESIYKYNYPVEFGFIGDELFNDNNYRQFGYQELFAYSYMPDNSLFEIYNPEHILTEIVEMEDGTYDFRCVVSPSSDSILYIYGPAYCEESYLIKINNEDLKAPYLYLAENTTFPNYYRNGFIECGTYECDEEVEIDIFSQNNIEPNLQIGFMNIGEFEKIINQMNSEVTINDRKVFKRKAVIDITASKPGYYIVPIGYSENWKVKVNGEKVDTYSAFDGMLLAIKVDEGVNPIEFIYKQKGFAVGAVLSLIGIALSVMICCIKKKIPEIKVINTGLYWMFIGLNIATLLIIWLIPVVFQIVNMFKYKIGFDYIWFYF